MSLFFLLFWMTDWLSNTYPYFWSHSCRLCLRMSALFASDAKLVTVFPTDIKDYIRHLLKVPSHSNILFDGSIKESFLKYHFTKSRDQYRLSIMCILIEFFVCFYLQWTEKICFDCKQGVLELKTWSQLMCNKIINKYIPKMIWSNFCFFA